MVRGCEINGCLGQLLKNLQSSWAVTVNLSRRMSLVLHLPKWRSSRNSYLLKIPKSSFFSSHSLVYNNRFSGLKSFHSFPILVEYLLCSRRHSRYSGMNALIQWWTKQAYLVAVLLVEREVDTQISYYHC